MTLWSRLAQGDGAAETRAGVKESSLQAGNGDTKYTDSKETEHKSVVGRAGGSKSVSQHV